LQLWTLEGPIQLPVTCQFWFEYPQFQTIEKCAPLLQTLISLFFVSFILWQNCLLATGYFLGNLKLWKLNLCWVQETFFWNICEWNRPPTKLIWKTFQKSSTVDKFSLYQKLEFFNFSLSYRNRNERQILFIFMHFSCACQVNLISPIKI
jgi:hypothetical protein